VTHQSTREKGSQKNRGGSNIGRLKTVSFERSPLRLVTLDRTKPQLPVKEYFEDDIVHRKDERKLKPNQKRNRLLRSTNA